MIADAWEGAKILIAKTIDVPVQNAQKGAIAAGTLIEKATMLKNKRT